MHRLFKTSIDTTDTLFVVLDDKANIRQFNHHASVITGYSSDEVLGRDWFELVIPIDDRPELRQRFADALEQNVRHWADLNTIMCRDGTSRLIRWENTLFLDESNGETFITSIGEDIKRSIHAFDKAKLDEHRYKTLPGTLPQYIYHKDLDYFILELASEHRKDDAHVIKESGRSGQIEEYVDSFGQRKSIKTINTPLYDEDGHIEGLVGVFWDITKEVESRLQLEEAKEMLANAEQMTHVGSWRLDVPQRTLLWSDEAYAILEVDQRDLAPSYEAFLNIVHPEDRDRVDHAYKDSLGSRESYRTEYRLKMRDGRIKTILQQSRTDFDDEGTPLVSIGTVQDITDQKEIDQVIARQSALLRSVIDATPDLIFYKEYDRHDGVYLGCNKAFEELVDRTEDKVIGYDDIAIFGEELGRSIQRREKEVLASGQTQSHEEWVDYADGRRVLLQTLTTPLLGLDDKVHGVIGVSRDMTARWIADKRIDEQREALQHQAYHDALTGLPNRILLDDRLNKAIAKASRDGGQFALLFIDLDQFKHINDSFGHAKGDMVLKEVALRLKELIRAEDTISRIGGDEFVIILEQLHKPQHASVMAEKIIQAMHRPLRDTSHEFCLTTSIGISVYPQDGDDGDDLMKNADIAMYKAKGEGRDNYQFYSSEMTRIAYERVLMESDLRHAITNDELVLFYQPKIDLIDERIEGLEVLLRWQHPRHGLILPSQFIPIAEESGVIVELGEHVLEKAIIQLDAWKKAKIDVGHIALNISTKQLQQSDFYERFVAIMERHACDAKDIRLEITEDYITKDPEHNIPVLKRFIDHGLKIAIDDFGSSYGSLSFLDQLPVDQLKLGRTFIQDFPKDLALTKAIIAMAKSLRLDVIAKGVETQAQSKSLKAEGCKEVQGYLYGRPANAEMTGELIRSQVYA